jgi:hypothetical protein
LRHRNPLPSEPDVRRFDASGSSMKQRTLKHAANLIGLEAHLHVTRTEPAPEMPRWWQPHQQGPLRSRRHICLLPNAGWLSSHVRPHQREVCPLAGGVMSPRGSTPIRPIAGRPSLAPSSFTRCPIRSSYDFPCCPATAAQRAYHVPQVEHEGGLGRVSSPVVQHLRRRSSEPPNLTTCLLAQACQHLWLVLCDDVYNASPGLTMPPHPRPRPP